MLNIKRFFAYFMSFALLQISSVSAEVSVTKGDKFITIDTATAKYEFNPIGGGFAHIFDKDNNDWIGSQHGKNFQGVPNLVYPADYFHPFRENCQSEIVTVTPSKASIRSWTPNDDWEVLYEIFNTHVVVSVLKKGEQDYWFLYEGEPGGKRIDKQTFWMNSAHGKTGLSTYDKDLPAPEWAGFGHESVNRTLYLLHFEDDEYLDHNRGNGCCDGMIVFGFGRNSVARSYLTKAPQHFAFGFVEAKDYLAVKNHVKRLYNAYYDGLTFKTNH